MPRVKAKFLGERTLCRELCNESSAVAEMGDRLATTDRPKIGGAMPILGRGS